MKTTTTNTTNTRQIMQRAHGLTRAVVDAFSNASYQATFALSLKTAWHEQQTGIIKTASDIWREMGGDEQSEYCKFVVERTYNLRHAIRNGRGGFIANPFEWIENQPRAVVDDELSGIVGATWARIAETVTGAPDPLYLIAKRAVVAEANAQNRSERRNPSAMKHNAIDIGASPMAQLVAPDPEYAAMLRDMIERAAADDTDREIISALHNGLNQTEIAQRLQMNQSSVARRIAKIRERI